MGEHVRITKSRGVDLCKTCQESWPCEVVRLRAEVKELRAKDRVGRMIERDIKEENRKLQGEGRLLAGQVAVQRTRAERAEAHIADLEAQLADEAEQHRLSTLQHCERIAGLEAALSFEREIVRVDKNAEIARLERRLEEREDEIRQWKGRALAGEEKTDG